VKTKQTFFIGIRVVNLHVMICMRPENSKEDPSAHTHVAWVNICSGMVIVI